MNDNDLEQNENPGLPVRMVWTDKFRKPIDSSRFQYSEKILIKTWEETLSIAYKLRHAYHNNTLGELNELSEHELKLVEVLQENPNLIDLKNEFSHLLSMKFEANIKTAIENYVPETTSPSLSTHGIDKSYKINDTTSKIQYNPNIIDQPKIDVSTHVLNAAQTLLAWCVLVDELPTGLNIYSESQIVSRTQLSRGSDDEFNEAEVLGVLRFSKTLDEDQESISLGSLIHKYFQNEIESGIYDELIRNLES